jgi:hypothetical protein
MDLLFGSFHSPDASQLSQVISQATGPAFILGAVAGFVSILLGRMTAVMDRIRHLNDIADDEESRAHLRSDIPRLRRRLGLLNSAARLVLASGVCAAKSGRREPTAANLATLERTLGAAGVEFIPGNGGGPGVRLRRPTET